MQKFIKRKERAFYEMTRRVEPEPDNGVDERVEKAELFLRTSVMREAWHLFCLLTQLKPMMNVQLNGNFNGFLTAISPGAGRERARYIADFQAEMRAMPLYDAGDADLKLAERLFNRAWNIPELEPLHQKTTLIAALPYLELSEGSTLVLRDEDARYSILDHDVPPSYHSNDLPLEAYLRLSSVSRRESTAIADILSNFSRGNGVVVACAGPSGELKFREMLTAQAAVQTYSQIATGLSNVRNVGPKRLETMKELLGSRATVEGVQISFYETHRSLLVPETPMPPENPPVES